MKTCAVIGQAAGTAAAMCAADKVLPRELRNDKARMAALQQRLLRDDQTILLARNEDPADLARKAKVTASGASRETKPENVISGMAFDAEKKVDNRWISPAGAAPAWLSLEWDNPVEISQVQLTHDTGLFRPLTMTAQASLQAKITTGHQPETTRDYTLTALLPDGTEKELARVSGNYQRLRRHRFDRVAVKGIRIDIQRAGAEEARLYEVRAYA